KAIASCYMENASGSHADRPELIRLLKDARRGDVLLVESIDRLVAGWMTRLGDPSKQQSITEAYGSS
ncbi:resolvase, putative, partial [Pseudomonas amygdali pv. mori str. 301020]